MEQLADQIPIWTCMPPDTPEPIVSCQCAVVRNLRGFVFPACCIDDERRAIESRVQEALDKATDIPAGRYYAVDDMDETTARFLAERRLITYEMLCAVGPRGVYVSDDQALAVMVNGYDHIVIRVLAADGKVAEAWRLADHVDDILGASLDFSYNERLGYLARSLRMVGTGLKVYVWLHLPGLVMTRAIYDIEQRMNKQRLQLCGLVPGDPRITAVAQEELMAGVVAGVTASVEPAASQCLYTDLLGVLAAPVANTVGNLFLLGNQDTLGLSEEEVIFHVEAAASDLIEQEMEARRHLMRDRGNMMLDAIGRALGIASSARHLGMGEALSLVSFIRMADAQGVMAGCDRAGLNRMLLECQSAHLQLMHDMPPDAWTLAAERARLFRAFFAGATIN